jgi:uncharacterized protein (TIGR03437 family)
MFGQSRLTATFVGLVTSLCVHAQTAKPVITAVANVASYSPGPVAPGEMVIIFGSGLGPSQLVSSQLDAQGRVATTLSNVRVLFDGTASPLIYVSQTVIAAMVPYGVNGSTTQVQVIYAGVSSDAFQKPVATTAPGIFSTDASGKGQAAINNSDGSLNSAANPATPGSFITFYVTGEGQTNPPGSDGNIAAGTANVTAQVSVQIAGQTAKVLYAGSAPGNVNGFAQINVVIPVGLQYGGSLPLVVQIGAASSQSEITVAISGAPAPIPNAPLGVSATTIPPNQIQVGWTAADALATHFHIEKQTAGAGSFTEIGVVAAATIAFTDSSAVPGTMYSYRVRAEDDYGYSPYSAVASASIPASQLAPPTNLQTVAVSQTQVNLTWNAANTNATSFQIQRKTGTTGTYAALVTLPSTATAYQDATVTANTMYVYRMQSQASSGVSAYSIESTVTTPAVPLPPAPTLAATTLSSSQLQLSWTSTATGVIRFRIERRTSAGQYSEINQPGPSSTTFSDSGLLASTVYFYRMRVETAAGLSPYSNEVSATTMQALPAAPTNLQAVAVSPTQINLTWINNAPDATAIRVEYLAPGSSTFTDIFAAATLTNSGVANLQANTTYSFRVRAQNTVGFSGYSNQVTVTTPSLPTTVFLLHGIGQSSRDMQSLRQTLVSSLDTQKYVVDATFSYVCASSSSCPASCSISNGAVQLANQILNSTSAGSRVILVGYSMGGLIARDMMANNYGGVTTSRKITALLTLGTPNLGYPYGSLDTSALGTLFTGTCPFLTQQMASDFRAQESTMTVLLSTYLSGLTNEWSSLAPASLSPYWLAISGGYCKNPIRTLDLTGTLGCPDYNQTSDGVVCDQSARYVLNGPNTPTQTWYGDAYAHASEVIMCGFFDSAPLLYDPLPGDVLSQQLISAISQH